MFLRSSNGLYKKEGEIKLLDKSKLKLGITITNYLINKTSAKKQEKPLKLNQTLQCKIVSSMTALEGVRD